MRWRGISTQPKRKGGTIWTAIKISHSEWICFDSLCASYYQGHSAILGGRQRAGCRCYSTAIIQSKDMFEPRSIVYFFFIRLSISFGDNKLIISLCCQSAAGKREVDKVRMYMSVGFFFYFIRLIPLKWKFIHIWFMLRLREHFWTQFYGARALLLYAIFELITATEYCIIHIEDNRNIILFIFIYITLHSSFDTCIYTEWNFIFNWPFAFATFTCIQYLSA